MNGFRPAADAGGDRFLGGGLLLPDALRRRLDAVRGLERLDLSRPSSETLGLGFVALHLSRRRKASLELVTQAGQFGQIGVVEEGLAEAGLVVAQLGLGDGEVLPDAVAFGAVAAGQAFQSVQDGTRSLVVPRKRWIGGSIAPSRYTSGGNCG